MDEKQNIQIYLLELIQDITKDKEWRHTNTQILSDGRVIIHLKLEKKKFDLQ